MTRMTKNEVAPERTHRPIGESDASRETLSYMRGMFGPQPLGEGQKTKIELILGNQPGKELCEDFRDILNTQVAPILGPCNHVAPRRHNRMPSMQRRPPESTSNVALHLQAVVSALILTLVADPSGGTRLTSEVNPRPAVDTSGLDWLSSQSMESGHPPDAWHQHPPLSPLQYSDDNIWGADNTRIGVNFYLLSTAACQACCILCIVSAINLARQISHVPEDNVCSLCFFLLCQINPSMSILALPQTHTQTFFSLFCHSPSPPLAYVVPFPLPPFPPCSIFVVLDGHTHRPWSRIMRYSKLITRRNNLANVRLLGPGP